MSPKIIEKQHQYLLTELKMPPSIPPNNSHEQLVSATYESGSNSSSDENVDDSPTLKDVKPYEWIVMLILCFVNLINYMDRFTLAGILQDIQDHFNVGNVGAGFLQTSFVLSYMIFAPLFGYLGDRYSRKFIMALGVALWSITTLLGSFMNEFHWFVVFRALVGIGEASYSTIAPTIISDLFVKDVRSKMLAFFYFAIPVGSGLGYIVGSETAKAMNSWQWALRVTPALGLVAVILILVILRDPERGQSEGSGHLNATSWKEDLKDLSKNASFILSTAGFTCVAFVAGALAWWGPKFIYMGIRLQEGNEDMVLGDLSFIFGAITMSAGIVGLTLGCVLSQKLGRRFPKADPLICGIGLFVSAPLLLAATYATRFNTLLCYMLLFFGQVALNLNWAIVSDILLYVVLPTRRSTAEGFQLLVSHALGDAGSPYLIGVISDSLERFLQAKDESAWIESTNSSETLLSPAPTETDDVAAFRALQYALFTTCFVEILGGFFFLINAFYILKDKDKVEKAIQSNITSINDQERRSLMS